MSGMTPSSTKETNSGASPPSRGRTWLHALADGAQPLDVGLGSMLVTDATWTGERVRMLAIVPDPQNRFPRARHGELGVEEGWALAHHVREAIAADSSGTKRPIVAIVDVQSQAYGRLEALLGIHLSLAAAADAYATARMAGHPVVALIVGTALSGGLLAHGDQAHRLLALDAPGVVVHAMRKASAARVTRRTVEELDELGKTVIPMSYDIRQFAKLGLLHELIAGIDADAPSSAQVAHVKECLLAAIADIRRDPSDLTHRLNNADARVHRAASIEVRKRLAVERVMIRGGLAPTHDLLRLREPLALTVDAPAPSWVDAALRSIPWVVVRRGYVRDGMVPVGVRGPTREQRFAAFLAVAEIAERLSPENLAVSPNIVAPHRKDAVPALSALARVAPILEGRGYGWGPGGSVGFELATGVPTATLSSDLDVILRQDRRLEPNAAAHLRGVLTEAADPARIDVLLETPRGGVSLADLAARPAQVLVRTPDGPRLAADPWMVDADAPSDGGS